MPRVNHYTVTGNADIPVRNHIRTADMSLFARGNTDITGSGADGAGTLTLRCPGLAPVVRCLTAANGETNTAGTHQTGFLRFLKAPGRICTGGSKNINMVTRRQ